MGVRWIIGIVGLAVNAYLVTPSAWAADQSLGDEMVLASLTDPGEIHPVTSPSPAAYPSGLTEEMHATILQEINATHTSDPALAEEMRCQLRLLETGELSLSDLMHNVGLEEGEDGHRHTDLSHDHHEREQEAYEHACELHEHEHDHGDHDHEVAEHEHPESKEPSES